jgi:protein involved in polysaccharide export with SLBB domain
MEELAAQPCARGRKDAWQQEKRTRPSGGRARIFSQRKALRMILAKRMTIALPILLIVPGVVVFGHEMNQAPAATVIQNSPDSDRPVLEHRNPRYRVLRDDVLLISFPLSPELVQTVTVQPDGFISLQSAGSLYVMGLTVPEIVEVLKKTYSTILHDPIVTVDLIDFQKPFFIVSGQVNKPGQFDLRYDITVTEAVAVAGGFAPTAKTQVFLFHRVSTDWVAVKKLKLNDILNGKNVNEDAHLAPGDMIFVPEKAITKFRKYVPYSIGTGLMSSAFF